MVGARFRARSTADMANGHAGGVVFAIQDNANVNNDVVALLGERTNSSDSTGDFVVQTYAATVAGEGLRVTYDKQVKTLNNLHVDYNTDIGVTDFTVSLLGKDQGTFYYGNPLEIKWSNPDTGNGRLEFNNGNSADLMNVAFGSIICSTVSAGSTISTSTSLNSLRTSSSTNLLLQTALGGTSVNKTTEQNRVTTTNATVTTIDTFATGSNTNYDITVKINARQTGGSGTTGHGASYKMTATFRNIAGTVTQIGTTTYLATHEDNAAWNADFSISGTNILTRVTGEASKNITWHLYSFEYNQIAS